MSTTVSVPAVDPARTALLAMDFQSAITSPLSQADELIARVGTAIDDLREAGCTIGYVRVGFTEEDWQAIPETNKTFAAAAEGKAMHHEDPATAVDPRIAPRDGDIEVRKTRFGGMSTTDLDEQLRARGIDTLVLTGVSTSGVVLSTLIDAADRDYRVYVLSDGVADYDPEAHHTLITRVFPSRAHVITTAELRDLVRNG
ncbi:cysteine hydrolase [Actinacidiphila sp. DG2A-62]|uniref:cysteine hydrolase n=1 Tax=Actinacidiphila sp. DG2A-62 TaxID=3108821 RepID=UPI002DBDDF81|nr:cysteine hydrolase [Actinacidiphila sp. DG2A-62]MEC3995385.1 cysteine hydrolase [Actinacidiphila sp. DG2A-62]